MWTRIKALVIKEFLALVRDPRGRAILLVPPLVQLFVFAYAATMEVKNVDLVIHNQDSGAYSTELLQRLAGSPTFRRLYFVTNSAALQKSIDQQSTLLALNIGPTFSRDLAARRPAQIQIIIDGRRANASQLAAAYLEQIVADLTSAPSIPIRSRFWFNPTLEATWFMVPNLVAVIAILIGLIVTGLSIARERELGTFDQLLVSPLRLPEILAGKTIPPLLIGFGHCTLFLLVAVFWFKIPLVGSLPLFYGGLFFYLLALVGIGLFLSAVSATQQQAILGAFLFMMPATLTSGFVTPIENMPAWVQTATLINPVRYFVILVRGTFLKGLPPSQVFHLVWPLLLIASFTLTAAAWTARRRME